MSKEILKEGVIKRDKGYRYYVDSYGNLCRKREHAIFNYYGLLVILILIAGFFYYLEMNTMKETLANPKEFCINHGYWFPNISIEEKNTLTIPNLSLLNVDNG